MQRKLRIALAATTLALAAVSTVDSASAGFGAFSHYVALYYVPL